MKVGEKVRLNEAGLKWATNSQNPPSKWKDRVGSIYRVSKDHVRCLVLWEGRKSPSDDIPIKFLETA